MFEKKNLSFLKKTFNKINDVSTKKTKEYSLPLVNAKHGNNGIMYYGREKDFESCSMCIDIVNDGAVSTGEVYPQPQKTGVLYNAYLIKPNVECSQQTLFFLSASIEKSIKGKYGYENKASWNKVKEKYISLPQTASGEINFEFVEHFIKAIEKTV